jgi:hypothetical protein
MDRNRAREIAEKVTKEELVAMFKKAQEEITDWESPSRINKGLSRGTAFNILSKIGDIPFDKYHILAKTNMVREFGEYLNGYDVSPRRKNKISCAPFHQEPNFI